MNSLAAAALAFALPFAALAQTAPPLPPPVDSTPAIAGEAAPAGALDLDLYPSARRDELWARYAWKNQLSVNLLYPVSGALLTGIASAFSMNSSFGKPAGVFSIPFEYERSLTRNWALFGVVQPTWAGARGQSEVTCAIGTGARVYFEGNAPQGLWAGLQADHVLGSRAVTVRTELGYNMVFDSGLTLSYGLGLGLTYAPEAMVLNVNVPLLPAAGLRVSAGYAI